MAIADVYDALTSKRCYKDAIYVEDVFDLMENLSGQQFDPEIMEVFLQNKSAYAQKTEELKSAPM